MARSNDLDPVSDFTSILAHQDQGGEEKLGQLLKSTLITILTGEVLEAANISAGVGATIYNSIAAGLAGTTNNQFFFVAGPDANTVLALYRNNGGVADLKGSVASSAAVQALVSVVGALDQSKIANLTPASGNGVVENVTVGGVTTPTLRLVQTGGNPGTKNTFPRLYDINTPSATNTVANITLKIDDGEHLPFVPWDNNSVWQVGGLPTTGKMLVIAEGGLYRLISPYGVSIPPAEYGIVRRTGTYDLGDGEIVQNESGVTIITFVSDDVPSGIMNADGRFQGILRGRIYETNENAKAKIQVLRSNGTQVTRKVELRTAAPISEIRARGLPVGMIYFTPLPGDQDDEDSDDLFLLTGGSYVGGDGSFDDATVQAMLRALTSAAAGQNALVTSARLTEITTVQAQKFADVKDWTDRASAAVRAAAAVSTPGLLGVGRGGYATELLTGDVQAANGALLPEAWTDSSLELGPFIRVDGALATQSPQPVAQPNLVFFEQGVDYEVTFALARLDDGTNNGDLVRLGVQLMKGDFTATATPSSGLLEVYSDEPEVSEGVITITATMSYSGEGVDFPIPADARCGRAYGLFNGNTPVTAFITAKIEEKATAGDQAVTIEDDFVYRFLVKFAGDQRVAFGVTQDDALAAVRGVLSERFSIGAGGPNEMRTELVDDLLWSMLWRFADKRIAMGINKQGYLAGLKGVDLRGMQITCQDDLLYSFVVKYEDGRIAYAVPHGGADTGGGSGGSASPFTISAPTLSSDWGGLMTVIVDGQSPPRGAKAFKPDGVLRAQQRPVATGRAFAFGAGKGPRVNGEQNGEEKRQIGLSRFLEVDDLREIADAPVGSTPASTIVQTLIDEGVLPPYNVSGDDGVTTPGAAFLAASYAVGGVNGEYMTTGNPALNRDRIIDMAARFAKERGLRFAPWSLFAVDHGGHGNRFFSETDIRALMNRKVADYLTTLTGAGGRADKALIAFTPEAAAYTLSDPSVYAPLIAREFHNDPAYPLRFATCPTYIMRAADEELSYSGAPDSQHRSAIAQWIIGTYTGLGAAAIIKNGVKDTILNVTTPFRIAANGLSAEFDFNMPIEAATDVVNDPAVGSSIDPADNRRPFGVMLMGANPAIPHATLRATGVTLLGGPTVRVTFNGDIRGGNATLNLGNYFPGNPTSAETAGGVGSIGFGPKRGARLCFRSTTGPTKTLLDPQDGSVAATFTFKKYAMPQRLTAQTQI